MVVIKHLFLILGLLAALTAEPVLACTSAVISGKVTPDGRPLLWKTVIRTICEIILLI